jgi:mannose-1-phosphate guanylyltransferase
MKAVLLVGGMGTRLRPLTYRIPKPLVPVMGKPLIMHIVDSVPEEVDEVIIPIGYKRDAMEDYIQKHPPSKKVTLVDEVEPLGTGGAVKNVEDYLDGPFLVLNGDVITSLDLNEFIRFHRRKAGIASISLWQVEDPTPFGVALVDEDDRIVRFQEKPSKEEAFSRWINAGAYALEYDVLDHIGEGFVSMEREVFPELLNKGMYGLKYDGYWIDCGTRESLLTAFRTLMDDRHHIDKESVTEGAEITPPAFVGPGAVVAGTRIGPYSYISERSVVGLRSTVDRSVVFPHVRIGTRCKILDSIIDEGVTVPDGTEVINEILSNYAENEDA